MSDSIKIKPKKIRLPSKALLVTKFIYNIMGMALMD